jgi:metal-responsive CopG/Arc/MetJ family transcriptional regulator
MSKYITVNFRKEYIDAVDEAVKKDPFMMSRAEFCRRAIENFLKTKGGKDD